MPKSWRTISLDRGDDGVRVDLVLLRHLRDERGVSRNQIQKWIDAGDVLVNGAPPSRAAWRIRTGDALGVRFEPRPPRTRPAAESIPLNVLYEDDELLAINKPAGLVVHPSYQNATGTLMNGVLAHARGWPTGSKPALLGRLDKHTSGVVLVTKSRQVHAALQRAMEARRIDKDYLAVVWGKPSPARGSIDLALDRDPWDRRRITVTDRGGQPSVTRYQRLATVGGKEPVRGDKPVCGDKPLGLSAFSLVRLRLITGRMHQIRVHLAAKGWPIVGDAVYGRKMPRSTGEKLDKPKGLSPHTGLSPRIVETEDIETASAFSRQALHAWRLTFRHPVNGKELVIVAPLPDDMRELLLRLGLPGAIIAGISGQTFRLRARRFGGRERFVPTRTSRMTSTAVTRVRAALARQPRMPLAALPTPIHDAVRLRDALGGPSRCPRILIKRDDLTALGLGGNKARKLEYLVADAQSQGATTLITTGAVQSNHARMTAAAACVAGMRCVLVLTTTTEEPAIAGNLLLDRLYGASVRLVPSVDPMLAVGRDEAAVAEVVAAEKAEGRHPYVIPIGGSSGIGVFGYVGGTAELVDQLDEMGVSPTRLYFASGSRGTQAGLTLGAKSCGAAYKVTGVAVSAGEPEKIERAKRIANEAATRLGLPERIDLADLVTDQGYIGEGYGIPTEAGLEAIAVVARTEAIVLDPCYTSKGMAALFDHVQRDQIPPGETVVFLHTGGMPAIFTDSFAKAFTRRRG